MNFKYSKYDLLLLLAGLPWLFNFKIDYYGEVYLSFLVDIILFLTVCAFWLINNKRIQPASYLILLASLFIVFHSWFLRGAGLSTSVSFEYMSAMPLGHYLKTILFGAVFFIYYNKFSNSKIEILKYINSYQVLISLAMVKYWYMYSEKILMVSSENLDAGRAYPEWIGGWNSFAMLVSFSIIFKYYKQEKSTIVGVLHAIALWGTLLSTQSRGGLWFTVVALILLRLLTPQHKLEYTYSISWKVMYYFVAVFLSVLIVFIFGESLFVRFFESFSAPANQNIELFQSATSGRSVQWLDLYEKFFSNASIFQYFFGYGIGHYAWATPTATEVEVHNMYLQFVYDFGLLFGLISCYFIYFIYSKINYKYADDYFKKISKALAIVIALSAAVEGLVFSTQTGWVVATVLALILSVENRRDLNSAGNK
jgi:hypothetical protein